MSNNALDASLSTSEPQFNRNKMAPIALDPPIETVSPPTEVFSKSVATSTRIWNFNDNHGRSKYNDFRADLQEHGFAVLKGVVPHDRAVGYQEKAYDWLRSFPGDLDFNDPTTWVSKNLPLTNKVRLFNPYCVAHEKFMWDARMEPGVLDAFSKLWGTDELLVSFDCLNVSFPNRKDQERRKPWEHIDQSPAKRGVPCVQGIINLSPAGPEDGGLAVYPGSHKLNDEFFATFPRPASERDVYLFSAEELNWFKTRGLQPHKVCADVGDLIMWDSRVIHYGSEPTEKSNQIRTVIYAAYQPAKLASKSQLQAKKEIFESFGSTTHWPYEHLLPGPTPALLEDGTRDPRDRDEPLERPELSEKLLKLAGVLHY